jgi:putative protein-disulfide isomerase
MIKSARDQKNDDLKSPKAGQLELIYYTDPLCCWSWAMEPQLRKLRYIFRDQISLRHCMGGLVPDWKNYNDEINSVNRPLQLGPVWMHAAQISGMPMQSTIWMQDPPRSSYPPCIAVKAVFLQSETLGESYLRLLREAIMLNGKNIANNSVLLEVADILSKQRFDFDLSTFEDDIKNGNGLESFRKDLQEVKMKSIIRFPSLIMKNAEGKALIMTGYRPFEVLLNAAEKLTGCQHTDSKIDIDEYKAYWQGLTAREAEVANNVID